MRTRAIRALQINGKTAIQGAMPPCKSPETGQAVGAKRMSAGIGCGIGGEWRHPETIQIGFRTIDISGHILESGVTANRTGDSIGRHCPVSSQVISDQVGIIVFSFPQVYPGICAASESSAGEIQMTKPNTLLDLQKCLD